jgi:hypothetical protein
VKIAASWVWATSPRVKACSARARFRWSRECCCYHHCDECWSIYEGELAWTLEGRSEPVRVKAGEWIFAPANTFHLIEVLGERPAIRIAITPAGEYHRHERADAPPAPPGTLQ